MPTYKAPGVYVEEISVFPPSVAEVATAIPAFIGYTQKAEKKGEDLTNVPTRISSLLEYRQYFGDGPRPDSITVRLDNSNAPVGVSIVPEYYMYDSLRLFYDNGGGDCYIVSVGDFDATIDAAALTTGLDALEKYDEPTIILFPDAVLLEDLPLYDVQKRALAQCERLMDRVAVFDLLESKSSDSTFAWEEGIGEFRDHIGVRALRYGAAYTPHLVTTLVPRFDYRTISLEKGGSGVSLAAISSNPAPVDNIETAIGDADVIDAFWTDPLGSGDSLEEGYEALPTSGDESEVAARIGYLQDLVKKILASGDSDSLVSKVSGSQFTDSAGATRPSDAADAVDKLIHGEGSVEGPLRAYVRDLLRHQIDFYDDPSSHIDTSATPAAWASGAPPGLSGDVIDPTDSAYPSDYDLDTVSASDTPGESIYGVAGTVGEAVENARGGFRVLFEALRTEVQNLQNTAQAAVANAEQELESTSDIYSNVVAAIEREGSVLPPSGAVAGVYAYVDRTRGVWKAPANVSLSSVAGPTEPLDQFDQEDLNVDPTAGKSINAIRAFSGKGTLVWGARTLAGNDNEWRYVSVRRFFNMVEESVKKSTGWAVFEPNDANTWTRVQTMIQNYLIQKWRDGALAGATPDEAFFVKVGLGQTMTPQDVLEGRMNVEIGMAVVRPAEFIILKFSHKMQEA